MTDAQLVQRVLAGEQGAYAELVRAHHAKIIRLCASLLRDASLAEDAAQDVFLKAYQALPSFHARAAFSTWLYRIAANHCLDLLRKQRREPAESLEELIETSGDVLEDPAVAGRDPRASVATTELVQRALAQLSPEDRLLLTLRELEGLSYQELADTLQCSVDAVKSRLRRARTKILEILRHFSGPGNV